MLDKECIENIGSPKCEFSLLKAAGSSILLKKTQNFWTVFETHEHDIDIHEFSSPYQACEILDMAIVLIDEDTCILVTDPDAKKAELMSSMYYQSKKFKTLEKKAVFLENLCFQLSGLEQLLPSLMEPFPSDTALRFMIDSLSTIFTCSCAYYRMNGSIGELQNKIGDIHFPETVENPRKIQYSEIIQDADNCHALISDENDDEYLIMFQRKSKWHSEELSILKSILSLFCKYRELLREKLKSETSCDSLSQLGFIVEIFRIFSAKVVNSGDFKELCINLCDSLKEIFQARFSAIYVKSEYTDTFSLNCFSSLDKHLEIPKEIEAFVYNSEQNIKSHMPERLGNLPVSKTYPFKPDEFRECFVVIGESVVQNYLSTEIVQILDFWLPLEITRAFSLLGAIQTMEHQNEFIQSIIDDMLYILDNTLFLESKENTDDILNSLNSLIYESYSFKFEKAVFGNDIDLNEKYTFVSGDGEFPNAALKIENDEILDSKKYLLAKFTAHQFFKAAEKSKMIRPEQRIIHFEDIVKPLLEAKYHTAGFPNPSYHFILKPDNGFNMENLEKYGVGVFFEDKIYFLTYVCEENSLLRLLKTRNI